MVNSSLKPWDDLVENLTNQQVITLLASLGSAPPIKDKDNNLVFQSVCHGSQSWKLCYYVETKTFFCYKEWESFSIFSLVQKVLGCDFSQAFKYISQTIGYSLQNHQIHSNGFFNSYAKEDWDVFEKYSTYSMEKDQEEKILYNPNILNLYEDAYYEGWIAENISIDTMKKFNIKYDRVNNRIIIPHYDIDGNLVGIRCRNLDPYATAKYCPIKIEDQWYSHSLSEHLYGLNFNKELIKRLGKVMIVESEKGVQQAETYFPNNNFVVACCGSNISINQIKLLLDLGIQEVQLGMDYDFHSIGNNLEYLKYREKILKLSKKLVPYFSVYCVTAFNEETTEYKYSPTDFSKDLLISMMERKNLITYKTIEEELPQIEEAIQIQKRMVLAGVKQ